MHHNCQFNDQSGWNLVEVVSGFCEVGSGCVKECPHSWRKKDKKTEAKADAAYRRFAEEIAGGKIKLD